MFGQFAGRAMSAAGEAARTAVGIAAAGIEAGGTLRHRLGQLLVRSDLADLAAQIPREAKAHGDVALARFGFPEETRSHMELLAQKSRYLRDAAASRAAETGTP